MKNLYIHFILLPKLPNFLYASITEIGLIFKTFCLPFNCYRLFSICRYMKRGKNSLQWCICIYRILTPCKNTDPQESGIGRGHTEPSWRTELSPLSDMTLLLTVSIFVHQDSTCISDMYGKSSSIKYLQSYSFCKNCGQNFFF